jgi:hypothetical protein
MPNPYPGATYEPSLLARDKLARYGLTVNDAIDAIYLGNSWEGERPRGFSDGKRPLKVLVEERAATLVKIVTVDTLAVEDDICG